jgi:hypothetical protein
VCRIKDDDISTRDEGTSIRQVQNGKWFSSLKIGFVQYFWFFPSKKFTEQNALTGGKTIAITNNRPSRFKQMRIRSLIAIMVSR